MFRRWRLACPPSKLDLVFPTVDGNPLFRTTILRVFYRSLRKARLRQVRFHSLRHSFASGLIATGAPITEVQHLCGHANPAITLKIYSHWYRSVETDAVGRFTSSVLGGTAEEWALSGHSEDSQGWLNDATH
jgi:integrase